MKRQTEDSRQIVDRFLEKLGEPLPEEQVERATGRVLDRLLLEGPGALSSPSFALVARSSPRWGAIAAGVILVLAGGLMALLRPTMATVVAASSRGELYLAGSPSALPESTPIEAGTVIRSGSRGAAFTLLDQSEIEMGPRTELSVVRGKDGLRILLTTGNVIVTAAEQRNGHLYVETRDCVVSVVGTVFTVNTEEGGSRISVIEGSVQVQRGDVSQTLLPGQQIATNPSLGPVPLEAEIEWSRSAAGLAALAQQSVPQPVSPPAPEAQVVRGTVKQSNGQPIPEITVTLCAAGVSAEAHVLSPGEAVEYHSGDVHLRYRESAGQDGPGVRGKAHFFALWDAVVCRSARTATTDSRGQFQFSDVAPGEYRVSAEQEGYLAPPAAVSSAADSPARWERNTWISAESHGPARRVSQNLTVEARQAPPEIALILIRGGVIAGRIQDSAGKPAVNATVRVVPMPARGSTEPSNIGIQTTTNDRGEYRAYWLLPGDYAVGHASGIHGVSWNRGPHAYFGAGASQGSETWYPRGTTIAEATAVPVREGEEVSNIDIILRDIPPTPR